MTRRQQALAFLFFVFLLGVFVGWAISNVSVTVR